ncbi:hypothetical protein IGS61_21565 [Janthinobacterium sp. FW305-129]|uniref:hypothetical protein n=1 Tax=Janthinobacterium sp. FW305-129 TaxID=2775054 RepID=UPI001E333F4C|nr:hypothetical protein [Janthinobacterium sp. FW305-129]MCC7600089.1 hypothetical protein [Janthinobacterium sp. FW305-129]
MKATRPECGHVRQAPANSMLDAAAKTAARNHAGTLFFFPTLKWPRVEDGYYTNAVTSNKSRFVFFILYAALVFST